jgi:asparagine synthase (glutamine-hydrolysing)
MTEVLAHRGPDGEGSWDDGRTALGHRRLAVIDLPGSAQPMVSDDHRLALVYNGEVYNFRELRGRLEARGHRFRTAGDTEVVLRGYEEWGDAVVERLRGMFAFAIWDGRRGRLLMARDRLGVKPLYYHEAGDGRLLFASEIKALVLVPGVPRALDRDALPEYVAFRGLCGGGTLFRGIRELPPATLAVREGPGALALREYWSASVPPAPRAAGRDRGALVAEGRRLLEEAVRTRLVSDVPLGTLNSGGLDSSLMSAIAARHKDGPLDTFCAGFEDPEIDERPYARQVAASVGSRHHEVEVTAPALADEIDRLTWANDEPIPLTNAIAMHMVLRHARREAGVTVVMSGEGADEVFGGYDWYQLAHRRSRVRAVPGARAAAAVLPRAGRLGRLGRLLDPERLLAANAITDPATATAVVRDGADPLASRRPLWPGGPEHADDLFAYDQRTYLQPILRRQDRMGMAAGVEAREPFLDHPMVEWANALPVRAKLADGTPKALLREMAAPWLPQWLIHRRKNGFAMPTEDWLRRGGPLHDRVVALGDPSSLVADVADGPLVSRIVDEHDRGVPGRGRVVWALVALDAWARIFLGPAPRAERLPGAPGA